MNFREATKNACETGDEAEMQKQHFSHYSHWVFPLFTNAIQGSPSITDLEGELFFFFYDDRPIMTGLTLQYRNPQGGSKM